MYSNLFVFLAGKGLKKCQIERLKAVWTVGAMQESAIRFPVDYPCSQMVEKCTKLDTPERLRRLLGQLPYLLPVGIALAGVRHY
jgi:hypothetical protein